MSAADVVVDNKPNAIPQLQPSSAGWAKYELKCMLREKHLRDSTNN